MDTINFRLICEEKGSKPKAAPYYFRTDSVFLKVFFRKFKMFLFILNALYFPVWHEPEEILYTFNCLVIFLRKGNKNWMEPERGR